MYKFPISICIPTFNRQKYLHELLESIYNDTRDLDFNFQIVISDNASSDSTGLIIENWIDKNLPIKYVRNNENFGMNYNIANCINYSDSEYSILMGDDDILRKGSLKILKDLCQTYKPDVIISDRYIADINMNIKGEEKPISENEISYYDFRNDSSMSYFEKTQSTIGIFSFISNLCIRTDSWKNSPSHSLLLKSLFPHAVKIMDILINQRGKLLYLPASTVITRVNDRLAEEIGKEYENSEFIRWNIHFEGLIEVAEHYLKGNNEDFLKFIRPIRNILANGRDHYIRMAKESGHEAIATNILHRIKLAD